MKLQQRLNQLKQLYLEFETSQSYPAPLSNLYDPVTYILSLGGKKMRPVFLLLACDLFDHNKVTAALPAAYAVELFHNFSLMHDDVMDNSDIRRGSPSVHSKYGLNSAILSGDAALVNSYTQILEHFPNDLSLNLLRDFNKMAEGLCEGQQLDLDFEGREDVSISDYIHMITLKTSVLLACSMKMGARIAGADKKSLEHLYQYALNAGIAFQIQDDILDTYGSSETTGKAIGKDIVNNKKTYLYLKAIELGSAQERERLIKLYEEENTAYEEKVKEVKEIFDNTFVRVQAEELMEVYLQLAQSHAEELSLDNGRKEALKSMVRYFIDRSN